MFIVALFTPSAVLMHFVLFCCLLFSSSFLGFKFIKCMRRFINFHSVDCCSCTGTMVWVQRGLSCKYVCICVFLFVCLYLYLCLYISTWVFVYIIYMYTTVNFSGSGLREGSEQQTCLARWVARVVSMDGPAFILHTAHSHCT